MKLILQNNLIIEVEKIDSNIEKNSVVYNGYTLAGEELQVYDLDNGKIAPIVRFLLTGRKKSKVALYVLIAVIVLILGFLGFMFFGKNEKTEVQKETTAPLIIPSTLQETTRPTNITSGVTASTGAVEQQKPLLEQGEDIKVVAQYKEDGTVVEYKNRIAQLEASIEAQKTDALLQKYEQLIQDKQTCAIALQNERMEVEKIKMDLASCKAQPLSIYTQLGEDLYNRCQTATGTTLEGCKTLFFEKIIK